MSRPVCYPLIATSLLLAHAHAAPVAANLAPAGAAASAAAPGWERAIQRGRLANGLEYYLVNSSKPAKQLSVQLLVRAGSIDESDSQSGVAHMVEHMLFHETQDFPQGIHDFIKRQGWRIGSNVNAVTNYERTLYMLNLAGDKQLAQWDDGLHMLSQMAGMAAIRQDSLDGERKIILEEWRGKLGVRERMDRQRRELLRAGSMQAKRPTIGTEQAIRTQPASVLQDFYRSWYHPNNMALMIVGDIDPAAVEARIRHWFAPLPAATLPARNPVNPELTPGLRIGRMQDAESGSSQVGWVYRFRSNQAQTADGFRSRLIDTLTEKLLNQQLQRYKAWLPAAVESLSMSRGAIGGDTYTLGFAARVRVDGHRAGMTQILQLQRLLQETGVAARDLPPALAALRAINQRAPAAVAARDQPQWVRALTEAVSEQRVLQDAHEKQALASRLLDSISVDDINARLRSWLASSDRLLFMTAPGLTPLTLPTVDEVAAEQARLASLPLPTLRDAPAPGPLPSLPDSPRRGIIRSAIREPATNVVRWTLGNGDRLIWLQRPNRDGKLRFSAQSAAGYRQPQGAGWQWQLAAQLGDGSDLAGWARGETARWEKTRGIRLSATQNEDSLRYQATLAPAQLGTLWQLYRARQMQTRLDSTLLDDNLDRLRRQLAQRPDSSSDQLEQAMASLRYPDAGPADAAPQTGELARVTLAGLNRQWQQLTRTPVTYFLSGRADEAQVKRWARRYLATITRTANSPQATPLRQQTGYHEQELAIGLAPLSSVRAHGASRQTWQAQDAIRIAALSRALHARLREELREKENGIYNLRFTLTLNPASGQLESELYFSTDPARQSALWDKARAMLAQPDAVLTDAQLQDAITQLRQMEASRQDDDDSWFNRLQLSFHQFGDSRYLAQSRTLADSLDIASLRALARRLDLTRDLAVVRLYPRPTLAASIPNPSSAPHTP